MIDDGGVGCGNSGGGFGDALALGALLLPLAAGGYATCAVDAAKSARAVGAVVGLGTALAPAGGGAGVLDGGVVGIGKEGDGWSWVTFGRGLNGDRDGG